MKPSRGRAFAIVVFALALASACDYGLHEAFGRPWPVTERIGQGAAPAAPAPADPADFIFVATADTHFGLAGAAESAARLSAYALARGAAFIIVAGDLVDKGLPSEYAEWRAWADSVGLPVLAVPGNHDLYNSGWSVYRDTVGASRYTLEIGGMSFYFIDSASGSLGADQLRGLELEMRADPRPKVLVSHYPLVGFEGLAYYHLVDNAERLKLLSLCAERGVVLAIAGHEHVARARDHGPFVEWIASSAISSGPGEGRGIVVRVADGSVASIEIASF
jgi:3',5'-cyclic AMP phosphodiesterase CpdA